MSITNFTHIRDKAGATGGSILLQLLYVIDVFSARVTHGLVYLICSRCRYSFVFSQASLAELLAIKNKRFR